MNTKKDHKDEGDAAYLSSFESSDRRRKILLITAAVAFAILVIGGFLVTLGSLGRLGKDVNAAFEGTGAQESTEHDSAAGNAPPSE